MNECPVSSGLCFCTGACRDSSAWDEYDPFPSDIDDFGMSGTIDFTQSYFWAFPQGELEGNSEALQFIINNDASLVEFYEGYVIVQGDFLPNLMKWGENGFTIVAIDVNKQNVRIQIKDIA